MPEYFSYFPTTVYQNTVCTDITRRVAIRSSVYRDPRAFAPYEVPAGERADQVAYHYYGSEDDTWLVYLSANVTDPYHDWYRSENDFNEFIMVKYGSYEEAVERVHHWQLDWTSSDVDIDPAGYEALADQLKKYYEPRYGQGSNILGYRRREADWTASTNMVLRLEVTPQNANSFQVGERVRIKTGVSQTGQAEVTWANSSVLKLLHVSGNTDPGNLVVGVGSKANGVITDRVYVANTIPVEERPFWSAVTCLEWERDKNESRKNIRLIDSRYKNDIAIEMQKLLAGPGVV